MILRFFFISLLLFVNLKLINASDSAVYTIPFTTNNKLLVFKGKLNGVDTDFAFDTGASLCVATSNHEKNNGVEKQKTRILIEDASQRKMKSNISITKNLEIGGFKFDEITSTIVDMNLLKCFNLFLLGSNVINQLNWEIDFTHKVLKVSKRPFTVDSSMKTFNVEYYANNPTVSLVINNKKYKNVLIDFGYTGMLDIPKSIKKLHKLVIEKEQIGEVSKKITSSLVLSGFSNQTIVETIKIDSIELGNNIYKYISADFGEETDFKIGLEFFKSNCNKVIINNYTNTYHLQLASKVLNNYSFPIGVAFKNNKLVIDFFENCF